MIANMRFCLFKIFSVDTRKRKSSNYTKIFLKYLLTWLWKLKLSIAFGLATLLCTFTNSATSSAQVLVFLFFAVVIFVLSRKIVLFRETLIFYVGDKPNSFCTQTYNIYQVHMHTECGSEQKMFYLQIVYY